MTKLRVTFRYSAKASKKVTFLPGHAMKALAPLVLNLTTRGNVTERVNRSTRGKSCPRASYSTTHPEWTGLGSNRISAVSDSWITSWAMARLLEAADWQITWQRTVSVWPRNCRGICVKEKPRVVETQAGHKSDTSQVQHAGWCSMSICFVYWPESSKHKLWGNLMEGDHLEDLGADGRIISNGS
jgi:hypothetical protein